MNAMTLHKPEVFVGHAGAKFDADGACTDDLTRQFVSAQMLALADWTREVGRMRSGTPVT